MKIQQINGIKTPSDNQRIARYFSGKKLKSILQTQEIWFSNVNSFPDKHERTIPDAFFVGWPVGKEFYLKTNAAKNKAIYSYITCWTKFDSENYALWKIYDSLSDGACLVTTVGKLRAMLQRDDMFLCEVKYIDYGDVNKRIDLPWIRYDNDSTPANMRASETYKIKPYTFEQEVRGIIYSKQKAEKIIKKVNLNSLIDEIIISPFATAEIVEKIKNDLSIIFDESIIQDSIILENSCT